MPRGRGGVTRFTVMAMLQAARAESLGLKRDSAYSWGLNRAIFYAAAKRGFRGGSPSSGAAPAGEGPAAPPKDLYRLGEDEAYRDPTSEEVLFTIGEKTQTRADFERQVGARFGSADNFRAAWDEATRIVSGYERETLESRQRFYSEVYKPRRDELSEDWTRRYAPPAPAEKPAAATRSKG